MGLLGCHNRVGPFLIVNLHIYLIYFVSLESPNILVFKNKYITSNSEVSSVALPGVIQLTPSTILLLFFFFKEFCLKIAIL